MRRKAMHRSCERPCAYGLVFPGRGTGAVNEKQPFVMDISAEVNQHMKHANRLSSLLRTGSQLLYY